MAEAMSTDYLVWNDTETILYFSKDREEPNPAGDEVTNTLWLSIRKDHLPADSPLLQFDMTVDLPGATIGSIVPKPKDILQRADGTRWTVELVEIVALENEYRVRVNKSLRS